MKTANCTEKEFLRILELTMAADPSPLPDAKAKELDAILNKMSKQLGHNDWIDALHKIED